MSEITKAVGQWILENVGWTVIIILFLLSCFFKIAKKEIDPLGWVIGIIGKPLTKDVRKDIADLKQNTDNQFSKIKTDRASKVEELKLDYDSKISDLRSDLDGFEERTNGSIDAINQNVNGMTTATNRNCQLLKTRLDKMEKSNDMQTIRQIKAHVLDFANSCLNKRRHTKKEFENIIKENEEYEKLVKKYKLKNDVYKEDFEYIMKVFHKCQEEGSFLKESDAES